MSTLTDSIVLFALSFLFTLGVSIGSNSKYQVVTKYLSYILVIPLFCLYYIAFDKTFSTPFQIQNGIYPVAVILPLLGFGILQYLMDRGFIRK